MTSPLAVAGTEGLRHTVDLHAGDFEKVFSSSGAVLVRPDGVVAARFPRTDGDPPPAATAALRSLLGR